MTKLEQLARAIQASDFEDGGIPWEDINPGGQSDYRKYARAAVEALRVPTDGMLDYRDSFVKKSDALLVWQHQIDEILNEKPASDSGGVAS